MAQLNEDSFRHKIEVSAVVMGGLAMASVLRCLDVQWDAVPAARPIAENILLATLWAPLATFLMSIATSTYTSYRSHAFAWWWVLLAHGSSIVCDALLRVCAANVSTLYFHVWLRYFISGVWFGVGGWIPSLVYFLWSSSSISAALTSIHELLSVVRVLTDLKCLAAATEIYFGAVIVLLAQEDWPTASRVLFGVGTGLCAGAMLMTTSHEQVYETFFARVGMAHEDCQVMMQSLYLQAIYLAAALFCLHLISRFFKGWTR